MATKFNLDVSALGTAAVKDDNPTSKTVPGSLSSQLAALKLDGVASKAQMLHRHETAGDFAEYGSVWKDKLRNSVNSSARYIKTRLGYEFTVEVSQVVMPSCKIYLVAVITRTA